MQRRNPNVRRAIRILWLIGACVFGAGCQQKTHFPDPDALHADEMAPADREHLARLVTQTFSADTTPAARAAAALATSQKATGPLATALGAIDRAITVCETNIANADTTAYKRFAAATSPDGGQEFRTDFEQGSLQNTGRQLDLGIAGQGLFRVKILDSQGDGYGFTRNGNFFVNSSGQIVLGLGDGYALLPTITLPKGTTDITISADGRVEVIVPGATAKKVVGQIQLARFVNQQGLNFLGGSLYTETEASGRPVMSNPGDEGAGQLMQGFLEASNVDPTRERIRIKFLQEWRNSILKVIDARRL